MRRAGFHVVVGVVALVWAGGLGWATDPAAQPATPGRMQVPSAARQLATEKLVGDVFGKYSAAPAAARVATARKMIEQAAASGDDTAARYVLLRDAADLSASVGDAVTAMHAAALLDASFSIDAAEYKFVLFRSAAAVATGAMARGAADEGVKLLDEAVAAGNYDLASRLVAPTEQAARSGHNMAILLAVQSRATEIRSIQEHAAQAKAAEAILARTPDDPQANLTFGRFIFFIKGDWRGLRNLTRGSEPGLKAAALADLANPTTPDQQIAVGNLWWDLAEKDKDGLQKWMRCRAGHWYSQAAGSQKLTGLSRVLVEKRLHEIPPGPPQAVASAVAPANAMADPPPSPARAPGPATPSPATPATGAPATPVARATPPTPAPPPPHVPVPAPTPPTPTPPPATGAPKQSNVVKASPAPSSPSGNVQGLPVADPPHVNGTPARSRSDTFTNSIGQKFVGINPGEFMMGTPPTEWGGEPNQKYHRVKLTRAFMMAATTVTQAQWKAVLGANPSANKGDDLPVDNVSWNDAVAFCEKLSAKEGKHYRLPTDAEWEYACRAGTTTQIGGTGNLEEMGWHDSNSGRKSHPVATKKPNAWGLYDMHGNVWQWCSDGYIERLEDATDPKGSNDGSLRVLRGGSSNDDLRHCKCAFREKNKPDYHDWTYGLRVCLDTASTPSHETASGNVPNRSVAKALAVNEAPAANKFAPGLLIYEYRTYPGEVVDGNQAFDPGRFGQPDGPPQVVKSVKYADPMRWQSNRNAVAFGYLYVETPGHYSMKKYTYNGRNYLFMDGKELGQIGNADIFELELSKGYHEIIIIIAATKGAEYFHMEWRPPGAPKLEGVPDSAIFHDPAPRSAPSLPVPGGIAPSAAHGTPATAPAPAAQPHAPVNTGRVVDLLALFPEHHTVVRGAWKMAPDGLQCDKGGSVLLNYSPPQEYDIHAEFVRRTGNDMCGIILPLGEGSVQWSSGGWGNHVIGFVHNVNGGAFTIVKREVGSALTNGTRVSVIVQVRQSSVKAFLNGELVSEMPGGGRGYRVRKNDVDGKPVVGLNVDVKSTAMFYKLEVVEIAGNGRVVGTSSPAQP